MKTVRCAIYTRKSSEEGLEQDFNSLHAQREACSAYILSQASEGWSLLPEIYDDGGLSGGNLERPALQRLLADVTAGSVAFYLIFFRAIKRGNSLVYRYAIFAKWKICGLVRKRAIMGNLAQKQRFTYRPCVLPYRVIRVIHRRSSLRRSTGGLLRACALIRPKGEDRAGQREGFELNGHGVFGFFRLVWAASRWAAPDLLCGERLSAAQGILDIGDRRRACTNVVPPNSSIGVHCLPPIFLAVEAAANIRAD
jgi:hypothetical protein